jgi:peptide/nickel transport system substrate-binding protein
MGLNDDKPRSDDGARHVTWRRFTAEDVAWSLVRVADPATGSPIQFVWGTLANHRVEGNTVIADVVQFDPTIFKWMSFLTGSSCQGPLRKGRRRGFESRPIGTGYMVEKLNAAPLSA